jgi:hypothetical protein
MEHSCEYALSLKQPWATLVVHGLKTIEVRSWPTARRGRILIHAARISDERPEAWRRLPDELEEHAKLCGGIVGASELTACLRYPTLEAFLRDQNHHLNDPSWYTGAVLYGFAFANPMTLPFSRCPGWMRFFPVRAGQKPRRRKSRRSPETP